MRRFAFVLGLVLALLLAAACEGEAGEDVGGDDALTAEDVFDEIVRAAAALDSVQVGTTYEVAGQPTYTDLEIITREGLYRRDGGPDELRDDCDTPGTIVEPAGICDLDRSETLWLDDEFFYRDLATGEWVLPGSTGVVGDSSDRHWVGTNDEVSAQVVIGDGEGLSLSMLAPDVVAEAWRFLPFLIAAPASAELDGSEEMDGEEMQVLVLRISQDMPTDYLDQLQELYDRYGDEEVLDDIREQMQEEFTNAPARYESEVRLLVDGGFRARQAEMSVRGFSADERLVHDETRTYVYSLHNEAELPGPLPQR